MRTRNYFLLGAALAAIIGGPVLADVTYTQGSGTTIFDFTCFTTKHCSAHVPITSAGVEILPATAANQASQLTQETAGAAALGTTADAVCGTATGTCSLVALQKYNNATPPVLGASAAIVGKVGIDQTTPGTTNNVSVSYGAVALVADPCQQVATVRTPISVSSAANIKIVTGTSAKKTHICGMMLFSAGTTNVGIVEGSGVNCGTSPLGLIGGATAATGPNLTAQAGFVSAPTGYAVASTTVNANDICLINGSAIQVSGYIVTATP